MTDAPSSAPSLGFQTHIWPQFRNDRNGTGRSTYTGPTNNNVDWIFCGAEMLVPVRTRKLQAMMPGRIRTSPTIAADGSVAFSTQAGFLYNLNSDGTSRWNITLDNSYDSSPALGWDGRIVIGTSAGVASFRPADGSRRWLSKDGETAPINMSPGLGPDGRVYVTYEGDYVVDSFDGQAGNFTWSYSGYSLGGEYGVSQEVHPLIYDNGDVVVGLGNRLLAVSQSFYYGEWSTNPKWSYSLDEGVGVFGSAARGIDGSFIFGGTDGNVYSVYPVDCCYGSANLLWQYENANGYTTSPAIAADGTIYFGDTKGLNALSSAGTLLWRYNVDEAVSSSPAVDAAGTIYFGADDGVFRALTSSGSLRWSYTTEDKIRSSPAIGNDGNVIVGSDDGCLYAFGPNGINPSQKPVASSSSDRGLSNEGIIAVAIGGFFGVVLLVSLFFYFAVYRSKYVGEEEKDKDMLKNSDKGSNGRVNIEVNLNDNTL